MAKKKWGRLVGGEWNKYFAKRDDRLQPGKRLEEDKWFLQRHVENPKKRVRVKFDQGWDHNHAENVIWCSCGFRRHAKRGNVLDERQKNMRPYKGQS